jgi:Tfp pilus assembly protein PilF
MKELPGDADLHIGLAEIYSNQKRTDKAEEEYRQAIALESNNEKARFGLAKLYLNTGRAEMALAELKKVRGINPQNKEVHRLMGEAYE